MPFFTKSYNARTYTHGYTLLIYNINHIFPVQINIACLQQAMYEQLTLITAVQCIRHFDNCSTNVSATIFPIPMYPTEFRKRNNVGRQCSPNRSPTRSSLYYTLYYRNSVSTLAALPRWVDFVDGNKASFFVRGPVGQKKNQPKTGNFRRPV